VWQPPSKQNKPVSSAIANQSTTTGSRTSQNRATTTFVRESSCVAVKPGLVSSRESSSNNSKTTVRKQTQSRNVERASESAVSAAQNNLVESMNSGVVNKKSSKTSAASSTVENMLPGNELLVDDDGASSQPASSGNRRLSDVNEPTKQPVAARLAAWKKKTAAVDNASTSQQARDKLHTICEVGGVHRHLMNDRVNHSEEKLKTNPSSFTAVSTGKASDSVPVTAGTTDDSSKTSFPPLKDGEIRQRTLPRRISPAKQGSVQHTWKKLGPATFDIQQKLTAMCENWKRNEIAEKSRKERAEDLAVVENRWRNGILADEQNEAVAADTPRPSTESEITSRPQVYYLVLHI